MPDKYPCTKCSKSFARPEHLRRHEKTHSARSRRFQCSDCTKTFSRRDVWRKHTSIHQLSPDEVLLKDTRACLNCALAKARCDRTQPCRRCASKRQTCLYPEGKTVPEGALPGMIHRPDIAASQIEDVDSRAAVDACTGQSINGMVVPEAGISHQEPCAPDSLFDLNWLPAETSTFAYEATLTPTSAIPFDFSVILDESWAGYSPEHTTVLPNGAGLDLFTIQQHGDFPFSEFYTPHESAGQTSSADDTAMDNWDNAKGPLLEHTQYAIQPEIERRIFCLRYQSDNPVAAEHIIHDITYQRIVDSYTYLCEGNSMFQPFTGDSPPMRDVLEDCLLLYRAHFHSRFPVIHLATDLRPESHWTLILAISAIGSQHLEGPDAALFSISMQEFLRRVMITEEEKSANSPAREFLEAKVRLLHTVGAGYLGHKLLFRSAIRSMSDLSAFCRSRWTSQALKTLENIAANTPEERWAVWRYREQKLRVGYGIWLLDAMWNFQHHRPPSLALEDAAGMPLPCQEKLWDASTAAEWDRLRETTSPCHATFFDAMRHLYVNKLPLRDFGPFEVALLSQGICHQTWGVQKHVRQGLSRFEPCAEGQPSSAPLNGPQLLSIWPPSVPLFNKWRNAACDSLDLLQVALADGISTTQRGVTFVHLHQACMVLLAPLYNIVRFASYLAGNSRGTPLAANSADAREDRQLIQSWAKHDHFKARAAATRAGAIFWEARRLGCNSFNEPPAVALAALVLWAYSVFATSLGPPPGCKSCLSETSGQRRGSFRDDDEDPSSGESSASDSGNVVLLDRPVDIELIEQFIRHDDKVDALLTGVGNIKHLKAPEKILAQARGILQDMTAWRGCSHGWIYLLENLASVTKKVRRRKIDIQRHNLVKNGATEMVETARSDVVA